MRVLHVIFIQLNSNELLGNSELQSLPWQQWKAQQFPILPAPCTLHSVYHHEAWGVGGWRGGNGAWGPTDKDILLYELCKPCVHTSFTVHNANLAFCPRGNFLKYQSIIHCTRGKRGRGGGHQTDKKLEMYLSP